MPGSDPSLPAETLALWLALEPEQLLRRCAQSPFQGPGPGGQKRNRVYSGVRLTHPESGLSAEASERREARRNLEDALRRLRMAMALSLPLRGNLPAMAAAADILPGTAFRPGASPLHDDFPCLVFKALHALDARGGRVSEAAAALGCTASALARFFASDKAVWTRAQAIRARSGLGPLKRG